MTENKEAAFTDQLIAAFDEVRERFHLQRGDTIGVCGILLAQECEEASEMGMPEVVEAMKRTLPFILESRESWVAACSREGLLGTRTKADWQRHTRG